MGEQFGNFIIHLHSPFITSATCKQQRYNLHQELDNIAHYLAVRPEDIDAYLSEKYVAPLCQYLGSILVQSFIGGQFYMYVATGKQTLEDVARLCSIALDEGQNNMPSTFTRSFSFDFEATKTSRLSTSSNFDFIRLIGFVEAIQASLDGKDALPVDVHLYSTNGNGVRWISCAKEGNN